MDNIVLPYSFLAMKLRCHTGFMALAPGSGYATAGLEFGPGFRMVVIFFCRIWVQSQKSRVLGHVVLSNRVERQGLCSLWMNCLGRQRERSVLPKSTQSGVLLEMVDGESVALRSASAYVVRLERLVGSTNWSTPPTHVCEQRPQLPVQFLECSGHDQD